MLTKAQRAASDLNNRFSVSIAPLAAQAAEEHQQASAQSQARKLSQQQAQRDGARDVRDATRLSMLWSAVYGLSDFVSHAGYGLFYPGPPVEWEQVSQVDFNNPRETKARVIASGDVPSPPWRDTVAVDTFVPSIPAGTSFHSAETAATVYNADDQSLGGKGLPRTVGGQVKSNLRSAVSSIEDELDQRYTYKVGECRVMGQAAISQAFLDNVRSRGKTVTQLSTAEPWSTTLDPGVYILIVDEAEGLTLRVDTDQLATPSEFAPGQTYVGHVVQVGAAAWRKYRNGADTACIDCTTNGCRPLFACVCDLQEHVYCPRSSHNVDLIPEVMQRDLDQLPTFNLVVGQVIAYLFSQLCTSTGDQVRCTPPIRSQARAYTTSWSRTVVSNGCG